MYSEKTFKNYIFWIQVKRVFLIILFSVIGATVGVLVSELVESIIKSNRFNVLIIVGTTIIMFFLSLLLTVRTGKEVQDGYWKIAVLRKLTTIQKLIETNNSLLGINADLVKGLPNDVDDNKSLKDFKNKKICENTLENVDDLEYEDDGEIDIKPNNDTNDVKIETENFNVNIFEDDKIEENKEEKIEENV